MSNIKYNVRSTYMRTELEIFSVSSIMGSISLFHLPIVRSYYNGTTAYINPSCIVAMMTMINIDYKYFASVRDPIIINIKIHRRGFGVVMNENEKKDFVKFIMNDISLQKIYKIKPYSAYECFGTKLHNAKIYDGNSRNIVEKYWVEHINYMYDCKNNYEKYHHKMTVINNEGYVNPMNLQLIDQLYKHQ
jgi:hypothetical protein